MNAIITIADVGIRQDAHGRYSLNDLHRAAGEDAKDKPANFLRLASTQALIVEIDQCSEVSSAQSINGGVAPGTYVAKELVYAYAMWISPAFHLKVIRAYDQMVSGVPALNLRQPGQMLAVAMQLAEICQEQQAQLTAQAPKVAFHDAVADASNTQTVAEVAKVLGMGSRRLFAFLRDEGILMVNNLPFQHHLDAGRFRVVEKTWNDENGTSRNYCQTRVTGKGLAFIQQRLARASETQGA